MHLFHGGDWAGYELEYHACARDVSANVSPLGLPEGVRRAAEEALTRADRYPDPLCRALRAALAQYHGVAAEQILCGNGAADLIDRLALTLRPRRALLTAPTFGEYAAALERVGCTILEYPLGEESGFQLTEGVLDWVQPGLELMILCEPNNPTGRTTPRPLLERILRRCGECGTLLVVDECFNEFLDCPEEHTLLPELGENLLILRAFTKSYAMAGLRLGYCLCGDESLLERMYRAGQPWPVSLVAQAAGEAALLERDYLERLRRLISHQRRILSEGLTALGMRVVPGEANFLLFRSSSPDLDVLLRERGVLIRSCAGFSGLGEGWYRVAVRTAEENQILLQRIREVMEDG